MSPSQLVPRGHRVAREGAPLYAAWPRPEADQAMDAITAGVDQLRDADFADCTDDEPGEVLLGIEHAQRLLAAQQARVMTAFDRRDAYRADACVSTGGWLRHKTNLGPGAIKRRSQRAELLQRMPLVAAAFRSGDIGTEHVDALDAHPSTLDGVNVAANVFVDLATWLGHDELARIKPRLGSGKVIDGETARHLLRTTNPVLRLVLGLGPWQPITVSRAMRTFTQWLSSALAVGMPTCASPGCDVPFWQCDIDHREPWELGGETALFNGQPLCRPHNSLKHQDGWTITFDVGTGVITWTSRDGTRVIDLPPPDL